MHAPSRYQLAVVVLAAIATLAAACSSDPTPTPDFTFDPDGPPAIEFNSTNFPDLSSYELDYPTETRAAWKLFANNNDRFEELFRQTWPLPELLLKALYDAGAGTAFLDTVAALEALDPPARFADDHVIVLQRVHDTAEVDARIGIAVRDGDVLAFARLNREMGTLQHLASFALSRPVCIANGDPLLCDRGEFDDGSYQADLHTAMRTIASGLSNTLGGLPLGLSRTEFMMLGAEQSPVVAGYFEAAVAAVDSLTPPEALTADHDRLADHLRNAVTLAERHGDAARAGDQAAFQETLDDLLAARCETRDAIAASEFRPVTAPYLLGPPPCPGDLEPPA